MPQALNADPNTPLFWTLVSFKYVYSVDSTEKAAVLSFSPLKTGAEGTDLGTKQLLNCPRGGETENKADISSACLSSEFWKILSKRPKFNFVQLGRGSAFRSWRQSLGGAAGMVSQPWPPQWKLCGQACPSTGKRELAKNRKVPGKPARPPAPHLTRALLSKSTYASRPSLLTPPETGAKLEREPSGINLEFTSTKSK